MADELSDDAPMSKRPLTPAQLAFLGHAYRVERRLTALKNHNRSSDSRINEAALNAVHALHAVERAHRETHK